MKNTWNDTIWKTIVSDEHINSLRTSKWNLYGNRMFQTGFHIWNEWGKSIFCVSRNVHLYLKKKPKTMLQG